MESYEVKILSFNKIQIELTNVCNHNCKECHRSKAKRQTGYMTFKTFKQSLYLCDDLDIKEIWLHNWGESLLHPDILRFIYYARHTHVFDIGLTTNGILLNKYLIDRLKESGLTDIDISFLPYTPIGFESHLIEMYKYARYIGINTSFRSAINNMYEYNSVYSRIPYYNIKWQRMMLFDELYERKDKCPVIEKLFVIYWDGTIVPCCQIYDGQIIYGTIGENIDKIMKRVKHFKENHLNYNICNYCKEVEDDMPIPYKLK